MSLWGDGLVSSPLYFFYLKIIKSLRKKLKNKMLLLFITR
nr:MAG TPA: hypothetical protein [Bacteriophage sp.]